MHYVFQVWDTAGQEAFRKVVTSIYRNVQAVLVVFDPHDRASFDSAQRLWLPEVTEYAAPNAIKMLVGLFSFCASKMPKALAGCYQMMTCLQCQPCSGLAN